LSAVVWCPLNIKDFFGTAYIDGLFSCIGKTVETKVSKTTIKKLYLEELEHNLLGWIRALNLRNFDLKKKIDFLI
jgi:hypothetical protein